MTTPESVIELMSSSKSESEWNANCDKVKAANQVRDTRTGELVDAYPAFWFSTVVLSGLMSEVSATW